MDNKIKFCDDWITLGWSREPATGMWFECGQSAGIEIRPESVPPELNIHDVAHKLNQLEQNIKELKEKYEGKKRIRKQ